MSKWPAAREGIYSGGIVACICHFRSFVQNAVCYVEQQSVLLGGSQAVICAWTELCPEEKAFCLSSGLSDSPCLGWRFGEGFTSCLLAHGLENQC